MPSQEELMRVFTSIRDIPYRIPLSPSEGDECCSGKHRRLKARLEALGLQTKWQVGSFKWSQLPLPKQVLAIPHADDSTHVFLLVLNGAEWIDVDATWDPALASVLPVNAWDGISNTQIAVPIIERFSLEKSREIMEQEIAQDAEQDLAVNGGFYLALNNWLHEVRCQQKTLVS